MADQPATPVRPLSDQEVRMAMRRLSRRSFATGAGVAAAGAAGLAWLLREPLDEGVPWPLRRILQTNERLAEALFSERRLAPEFPASQAAEPRANGRYGLGKPFDAANWRLRVIGDKEETLPLAAVRDLPRVEMTTEFKCIEGWSQVITWAGARLADFAQKFSLRGQYVGLTTPDSGYFVGLDAASALHPQTLLAYEMNGAVLAPEHGAPLRLVAPVKYGVKSIKRIGTISFTDRRPRDYWAERGYDWYAGL